MYLHELQRAAGLVLQQLCAVLHISREDFCCVMASFLNAGAEKDTADEKKRTKDTTGKIKQTSESTILSYFQKLPKKYLIQDDGFQLFEMVVQNTVQTFCEGNGPCTVDEKAVSDSWEKNGDEIIAQFEKIHKKAVEVHLEVTILENRKKIEDLLSN